MRTPLGSSKRVARSFAHSSPGCEPTGVIFTFWAMAGVIARTRAMVALARAIFMVCSRGRCESSTASLAAARRGEEAPQGIEGGARRLAQHRMPGVERDEARARNLPGERLARLESRHLVALGRDDERGYVERTDRLGRRAIHVARLQVRVLHAGGPARGELPARAEERDAGRPALRQQGISRGTPHRFHAAGRPRLPPRAA